MKKIFLVILTLGILCQVVLSQNFNKDKLDDYFDVLESNNKFMGSVAVSQNGEIIYSKSLGFSDYEKKLKANESTKYGIGSISKTFTAVLVFKGVEEKRIDINQTINKYFPTIENSNKITIEDLLYHRSGIHNFTDDKDYLTWNTQPKTEKEMVTIIANKGSDFEPNSKSQYSNSNYILLSYILEKSYQKSYGELLKEYITAPIGLKNTYFGETVNNSNKKCNSYRYLDRWKLVPETDISVPMGAGGIVSTPIDLVKFSNALFDGQLLNSESLKKMMTIKENFGIGLFQIPFYNKVGFGHTGGIDGFTSVFSHFSDGDISYALISNGTNYTNNDISISVLSAVYNKPYETPTFSTIEVKSEDLDKYLGIYSSAQLPMKITVTKNNNTLIAQATGQSSFPLEATEKDKFKFDQAGIVMEFNPSEKTMILKQGGGQFLFTKN
ncbi:serine hydrolase [Labilibaculum sp. A4]|uniref:serine hydrolase domain-containing protein n=1 Tax=Labilibaculum euxinus TaxID=2686357 RepID=UPI000F622A28|nr:serine hydrolase domain-containing protein [Labilibaculum euxinus]MDQ1772006.1 serine hydrolase domain-containing protein [Labilibaculum euxinus]MWN75644.1 serine hydrolase [Labilibaculum euxinus]